MLNDHGPTPTPLTFVLAHACPYFENAWMQPNGDERGVNEYVTVPVLKFVIPPEP